MVVSVVPSVVVAVGSVSAATIGIRRSSSAGVVVTVVVRSHIGGLWFHGHSGSGEPPAPAPPGTAFAVGIEHA